MEYPQSFDTHNLTEVGIWYETHDIPQRLNPIAIVASILVSILGSYATLMVLGKRTSHAGLRNAMLLVWAAFNMACVGIWGMHFIGMSLRLQPIPEVKWFPRFSPGFTVFSLIVPCLALIGAFVFVDHFTFKMWRVLVSGTLTGCIVGLMHYSASMRCNFEVNYSPAQVVVSIVLACICANVALVAFFRLREQWQDSWIRRLACAFVLSSGVSGMHYVGIWGTSYRFKRENIDQVVQLSEGKNTNTTVLCVVGVMCFVIAFASTIMSYNDAKIARKIRKGSRKIVIASASFDHLGRLLVKADGSLPLVTLEEKTLKHEELLQVLDIRSDTFQWLYAVSWAWHMVTPYLGAIATTLGEESFRSTSADKSIFYIILHHLRSLFKLEKALPSQLYNAHDPTKKSSPLASIAISHSMVTMGSKAAIDEFRDKVVDGARRLAEQLELPIDEVGILYDKILSTNTQSNQGKHKTHNGRSQVSQRKGIFQREQKVMDSVSDEESVIESRAASVFGDSSQTEEGISIFLVRQVSQVQQNSFAKRGYRFTEPRFLATVLADRHVVDKSLMDETLDSLQQYSTYGIKPLVQPGGVYAGLFGVRPSTTTRQGGLDVLVYHFARHQIPAFRLPDVKSLTNEMLAFLRLLDQLPVEQAMRFCQQEAIRTAERNRAIISMLMEQKNDRIQREFEISSRNNGSISATSSKGIESDDWNESVRHVLGMRNEAVSLQTFQSSLHSALTALLRCARVYQDLATTARISANVLEVPSTLDDSSPPASIILIQAALSGDKKQGRRGSSSTLSGFLGPSRRESRQGTGVLPSAEDSNASVIPTEMPQAGTPFVFYPYTMFAKAQMMIFQGHTAEIFNGQVNTELTRRYSTQHDIAAVKDFYDPKRRSADSQHFNNCSIHEDASSPYRRGNSAEKGEEGVEEHSLAKLHRRSPSLGRLLYFRRDSESSLRSQEKERRKSDPCTVPPESKQSYNGIKSEIVSPNQEKERSPTSLGIRRFIENPETAGLPDQRHFARALDEETMHVPVHPLPDRAGSLELNINLKSVTEQKERYQEHLSSTSLATHPLNNEARIPTPTSKSDCDVPIADIHLRPRSRTVNDCRLPAATSMLQAIGSSRMSLSHVRRNKSFGHGAQLLKQDETTTDFSSHQGGDTTLQRHHRLDNWQQHQLNDLERYQPNLLLGVLPSEY